MKIRYLLFLLLAGCSSFPEARIADDCKRLYPDQVTECRAVVARAEAASRRRAEMRGEYAECAVWVAYSGHKERHPIGHCQMTYAQMRKLYGN